MTPKQPELKTILAPLLEVLKQLGGQLVFADDEGEQFVIMSFEELKKQQKKTEAQLPLLVSKQEAGNAETRVTATVIEREEITQRINRDIALAHLQDQAEQEDDLGVSYEEEREEGFEQPETYAEADDEEEEENAEDPFRETEYRAPAPPPVRVQFEPLGEVEAPEA